MERFNGKTILITGAGDIAQATARRLLSEGGCVALTDFSQDALADFMIHKAGLGLSNGKAFDPSLTGFMRLNVACPRSVLEQAMGQLKRAVDAWREEGR